MDNEKTIIALNNLITINNDRIDGYESASQETEEEDMKTMFAHFATTSQKCKQDLSNEVVRLGGTPAEGTMTSGKIFRMWMDVKAALTGNDRKAILNSCEYGEDMAIDTYKNALENDLEDLNAEQQSMIKAQLTLLKADHDDVKSMIDSIVTI